ncbi:MAG: chromophore lyase CpcT/CpeT [Cyclobacteriaceae bacterium]
MKKKSILFIVCFAAALVSLALQRDEQDPALDKLAAYLTGHFHSGAQAAADSSYHEIHLHTERIWPERTDGYWLYVEQGAADSLNKPYHQRIYHVMRDTDTRLVSVVYEFTHPDKYAGGWEDPAVFEGLTPSDLQLRNGCEVWIEPEGAGFIGEKRAGDCTSKLRGANSATSIVEITSRSIRSWDKGYNSANLQTLVAGKGGYAFVRQ